MKSFIILFLLSALSLSGLQAQDFFSQAKEVVEETSDPEATAIMEKVKAKYEQFKTIQVEMRLVIKGETEEVQDIKAYIEGDKYRLEMSKQDVICDGTTIWFHLKDLKEVQINNPSEEDQELTPAGMIKIYEQDMVYVMVGEAKEDDRMVHKIEFKPKDRDSDFSKFRVSIDKESNQVSRIIAFDKSASTYTITFKEMVTNKSMDEKLFIFDPEKFEDISIEDLRSE